MRILDLDLDFFLYGTAHMVDSQDARLDPDEYPPWSLDSVMSFLIDRCRLDGPRSGFVVEHHNELFYRWGRAIETGDLAIPAEVVHVDAHADLGLGDSSYTYLIDTLAFQSVEMRYETLKVRRPRTRQEMLDLGNHALTDGNWLMFALACGWIADLLYVSNSCAEASEGARPNDLMYVLMQDFDLKADHLQIVASREKFWMNGFGGPRVIEQRDPPIPFATAVWREYTAAEPFDMVCLTRSPQYTPAASDAIFDAIRQTFIEEFVQ